MVIVYAKISSWVGISIGATHCYLKLKWDDDREYYSEDVQNVLSANQAKELNKAERKRFPEMRGHFYYKKGDEYQGFWTIEEALERGVEVFKNKFDDNDILMLEVRGTISIGKCLYCKDEKLKKKLLSLYEKAEKIGWYDDKSNDEIMEKIDKDYHKMTGQRQYTS